jgi:hypothetical protein
MTVKIRFYVFALVTLSLCFGSFAFGQEKAKSKKYEFCSDYNYSNGDKVSFNEVREFTLPAGGTVEVDGERNDGIKVKGSNRTDVLVRACVRTNASTEEAARTLARDVRVSTSPVVRAEAVQSDGNWSSVSYEILVPRSTNLKLTTQNGGIGISGVDGNVEFSAANGGIHLNDVAGDVRGKTTNGGLHVQLAGNTWKGTGLDVVTTNGGVHLSIPETYAARIETGTTNGGFKSDIAALQIDANERKRGARLTTDLNGGGAPIRLITTNGGVKISSSVKSEY